MKDIVIYVNLFIVIYYKKKKKNDKVTYNIFFDYPICFYFNY